MACRAGAATENKLRSAQQLKEGESDLIPDVTLQVEGEKFYVNRKQLALQSPYFRALFFGSGIESTKRQVCIKGVDLQHFQVLMEHSRTSRLALSRENVQGILETADFLQLERARLLCCKFLERQLHITNCLGMMAYAWRLGCNQLYKAARQVALSHFPALLAEEEFLSLPKEAVADLLASDDLAIANDDLALEATLRWVSVHPERGEHLLELAGLVRPESLSVSFITQLLTRMKSSEPRAELIRTLNHGFPASWSAGQPRRATRARESLFVLGGPHDQEQQWLYQFHPLSGRWQRCAPLQRKNLTQYSVAAVGDSVVVTGGYFRDVLWFSVDWVKIYECQTRRWVDGPALQKSRHSHCSVGLDSALYVLGGSTDEGLVADVERLVVGSDEGWRGVSPMVRAVERAASAALGPCLYVACGLDENGEVFSGIQRYDLVATELNGALFLFGGQALRLDLETEEWTLLEENSLDGKFFSGCTTVGGQMYLLSESKGNQGRPNMVLVDPYIDTCVEVDDAIPCPVPLRGCVTVRVR
ncbi:unnamed protein product [Tetraodon nigroviridis]|uniref:(spotted green pufferfish) hypothetical protein n=1 Tax=Tetraodon nigroviridis TaxID=99883 RepID=Q4RUA0_TETNG|nr:unnamed protein product [Tetraodon nigroviridis]